MRCWMQSIWSKKSPLPAQLWPSRSLRSPKPMKTTLFPSLHFGLDSFLLSGWPKQHPCSECAAQWFFPSEVWQGTHLGSRPSATYSCGHRPAFLAHRPSRWLQCVFVDLGLAQLSQTSSVFLAACLILWVVKTHQRKELDSLWNYLSRRSPSDA